MSTNKKAVTLIFILAGISLLLLTLLVCFRATEEKIDCTATVKWIDYQKNKTFSGTIVFDLVPKDDGLISINGLLKDDANHQTHHIRREISVNSGQAKNSKIGITFKNVHKHISDTSPDNLFNKYLIDTSAETTFLDFKKLYNGWLISTPYTAAIMCVNTD